VEIEAQLLKDLKTSIKLYMISEIKLEILKVDTPSMNSEGRKNSTKMKANKPETNQKTQLRH
jgi:hypothetical protein